MGDIYALFETLTSNGIKVAVVTSDNRKSAEIELEEMKVTEFVSALVCGDDEGIVANMLLQKCFVPLRFVENLLLIRMKLFIHSK